MNQPNLLAELTEALQNETLLDLSSSLPSYACVVILLRGTREDLEVGYIRRSVQERDRWSGQIAFPGGKKEDTDETDMHTALRETEEEIGLKLQAVHLAGRLDDIQARKQGEMLDFFIRPFVFLCNEQHEPVLQASEVAEFFWVPLKDLRSPERQTHYRFQRQNMTLEMPAIDLSRELPLWGLTYFMTQNLLLRLRNF